MQATVDGDVSLLASLFQIGAKLTAQDELHCFVSSMLARPLIKLVLDEEGGPAAM